MRDGQKRRFWRSLPGAITAAAGLISAIAALVGGLVTVGLIGGSHSVAASTATSSASSSDIVLSGSRPAASPLLSGPLSNGPAPNSPPASSPAPSSPIPSSPTPSSPTPSSSTSSNPPPVRLDQVDDPAWTGGVVNIAPANRDSQVFTPSLPHLIAIEVALMTINAGRGGDTVTLTILDGNGQQVATASAAVAAGFDGFWRFNLADGGPPVTPGQPLTMMLHDSGTLVFGWKYVAGRPYPRGQANFDGSTFGTNDFLFRTYGAAQ